MKSPTNYLRGTKPNDRKRAERLGESQTSGRDSNKKGRKVIVGEPKPDNNQGMMDYCREDQNLAMIKSQKTMPEELDLVMDNETREGESSQWVRLQQKRFCKSCHRRIRA